MARVAVPTARARTIDLPDGLTVVIPAKRNLFLIGFVGLWMVGWAFGEVTVISQLVMGKGADATAGFLYLWLTGWTLGGLFAGYLWVWTLVGKEIITLRPDSLSIKADVLGLGRTREYELAHVRELRVAPPHFNPFTWTASLQMWGMGGGLIAFDYGARTYRFGASIDEAEAKGIVSKLSARHTFQTGTDAV